MDWLLVLILSLDPTRPVLPPVIIPAHKSEKACKETLANLRKQLEKEWEMSERDVVQATKRSFCVEKGR